VLHQPVAARARWVRDGIFVSGILAILLAACF
jgi:hypothetical protein